MSLSFFLHCIAIIPCPAQGMSSSTLNSCVILFCNFKESMPALESSIASNSPFSNFWILVSTFPLINLYFKSDLFFFNWNSLLKEEVPIIELGLRSSNFVLFLLINISFGEFLFKKLFVKRLSVSIVGISFSACTAISISSFSNSFSIFSANNPLPPISDNRWSCFWSPVVTIFFSFISFGKILFNSFFTFSA